MFNRLLRLFPLSVFIVLLAVVLPAPAFACAANTNWTGTLNGDVSKSVSNVPAGAKITISITTTSGCVYADGKASITADGDKVFNASFDVDNGSRFDASHTLESGANHLTVALDTNETNGPVIYTISVILDGSSQVTPPDHRNNWMMGDDIAAVYPETDVDGNPELRVYAIGEAGKGEYQFTVTLADLQPWVDNPPASNTEIKAGEKAALYALDSGEFQISLGPDDEGKYYDLIFSGLPVEQFKLIKWTITDVIGG